MTYENATVLTPPMVRRDDVCGGRWCFVGTRFPVANMRANVALIGAEQCKQEWPHIPFWWIDWCAADKLSAGSEGKR